MQWREQRLVTNVFFLAHFPALTGSFNYEGVIHNTYGASAPVHLRFRFCNFLGLAVNVLVVSVCSEGFVYNKRKDNVYGLVGFDSLTGV